MSDILRFNGSAPWDPDIDQWLAEQKNELGVIALQWFSRLRDCGDDVRELMHDGHATALVKDAPFAYVGVFKAHVNLGFFHGAHLDDPADILEGTGKRMRHIKLRPSAQQTGAQQKESQPPESLLQEMIGRAYADIKQRL